MYKIVRSSRLYEQIVQQVEESIQKGSLKPGDQLPPERELAQQFGVTVRLSARRSRRCAKRGLWKPIPGAGHLSQTEPPMPSGSLWTA